MATFTFPAASSLTVPTSSGRAQDRGTFDRWQSELGEGRSRGHHLPRPRSGSRADAAPRQRETKALLREAALRLRPEYWLSPPRVKRADLELADVWPRHPRWTAHSPFDTAPADSWRDLVDLAISYSSHTYRPVRGVRRAEAGALVAWFTCFWKLDNLVDGGSGQLPARYLGTLRHVMERAWFGDEERPDVGRRHPSDLLAFPAQATALLLEHRQQLRALGQRLENHPRYRDAVWKHIVCQTEAPPQVGSLEEYLDMRRVRGGMECVFHMYLALQGIAWEDSFAPIVDAANLATCLVDDLFSAPKDRRDGVVSSLTVCGPQGHQRVLETVGELHRELLKRLERRVEADDSASTQLLVRTVLDVVLGMLQWQGSHPRYREGARWLTGLLRSEGAEPAMAA